MNINNKQNANSIKIENKLTDEELITILKLTIENNKLFKRGVKFSSVNEVQLKEQIFRSTFENYSIEDFNKFYRPEGSTPWYELYINILGVKFYCISASK